ncbi:AzlC family ABC transporter permease [Fodinicurvata sp. EGI_FJ10296]|uniref:AzlC family ABC transporter permease n=1 Tax=Fodinicurvata sp. EGI_FJ10296 TaxID=3231908 RepID=UPI003452ED6D
MPTSDDNANDISAVAGSISYGSPGRALGHAALLAFSAPGIVMTASYVGFGSLVRASDLTLAQGVLSSMLGYALPGQIALVELYAVGSSLLITTAAVALTNVRLLPMVLALMPHLRAPGTPRWRYYAAAHLIAITGWVYAMRDCPRLPPRERLSFLVGFSGTLFLFTVAATVAGFFLAGSVPPYVSLGLVFLNPIYFMLVLTADLRDRARLRAMVLGAVLGPLFHLVNPDWGLLATGFVAGTLAYLSTRLASKPPAAGSA